MYLSTKENAMSKNVVSHDTCRLCGSQNMRGMFSLGDQFINDFVDKEYIENGSVWGSKYNLKLDGQITGKLGPTSFYDLENKKNRLPMRTKYNLYRSKSGR